MGIHSLTLALALLGTSACGGGDSGGAANDGTGGANDGTGGASDGTGGVSGDPECPSGCLIDGSCIAAGEEHSDDPCQLCLPDVSATDWSADEMCCDDEPTTLDCNDDGNVVGLNACGDVVTEVVQDCSEIENRTCYQGACACAPGWTGDDCERTILYVRMDGDDEASGRTWNEALATVGAALEVAAEASIEERPAEIWVAAGTYTPQANPESPRHATFQLVAEVQLYGGFAGFEQRRAERDFAGNVTVLSGDIGVEDDASDNVYHVVTGATGATLDGFTVTGGNANGSDDSDEDGAGMLNVDVAVTVANCLFTQNSAAHAGGGMYNGNSTVTMTGSTFTENVVVNTRSINGETFGGGMLNLSSTVTVSDSVFMGNEAVNTHVTVSTFGGGMHNMSSTVIVADSVFARNSAKNGGAMYNGTIAITPTVTITGSVFTQNSANNGGGMYNIASSTPFSVSNSILSENTGGDLEIFGGTTDLSHSIVEGGCPASATCTAVLDADPLFVDPENEDFRLKPGSPAIDAGSNEALPADVLDLDGDGDTEEPWPLDFAGRQRVIGPRVDMGPYEASCDDTPGAASGIGAECAPVSCAALLTDQPESVSGEYWLDPGDGPPFRAGCDMTDPEGPWTLLFQQGPDFDPSLSGDPTSACTYRVCTSAAYDRLLLGEDLRFDASNELMSSDDYVVRTTVAGIDASLVGNTLFDVLGDVDTTYYVEQDDNGNVHNEFAGGFACGDDSLPFGDYESLICEARVLTFNDPAGCDDLVFTLGGDESRSEPWANCAGWSQMLEHNDVQHFPTYLRVWTR